MIKYSTHKATRVDVLHESDEDGEYIVISLSGLYPHGIELCLDKEIWHKIVEAGNEIFNAGIPDDGYRPFDRFVGVDWQAIRRTKDV